MGYTVAMQFSELPGRLRDLRVQRKIRQVDVADALGIDDTTMSKLENGKLPVTLDRLDLWLKALKVKGEAIIWTASESDEAGLTTMMKGLNPDDATRLRKIAAALPDIDEDAAKDSLVGTFLAIRTKG